MKDRDVLTFLAEIAVENDQLRRRLQDTDTKHFHAEDELTVLEKKVEQTEAENANLAERLAAALKRIEELEKVAEIPGGA